MSSRTAAQALSKTAGWKITAHNQDGVVKVVARLPRRSPSKEQLEIMCDTLVRELCDLESFTIKRNRIDFITTLPPHHNQDEITNLLALLTDTIMETSQPPSTAPLPQPKPLTRRERRVECKKRRHRGHRQTLKKRGSSSHFVGVH